MSEGPQEDPTGTVELSGGYVYLRWCHGAWIDESAARAVMTQARELCSGKRLPILVEMSGMKWMDHRAGAIFAAEWSFTRTAIVGSSPVDEVIATFYTARHQPVCPTQFFFSISNAMAWLQEQDSSDQQISRSSAPDSAPSDL